MQHDVTPAFKGTMTKTLTGGGGRIFHRRGQGTETPHLGMAYFLFPFFGEILVKRWKMSQPITSDLRRVDLKVDQGLTITIGF